MHGDSVVYTIGTALNRAHDNNISVQILVEGHWLSGSVVAVDGHGVVLNSVENQAHSVIRMDSVSAVRILAEAPQRRPVTARVMPMQANVPPQRSAAE
jgi:sRNA-binding regulator protein Hfq